MESLKHLKIENRFVTHCILCNEYPRAKIPWFMIKSREEILRYKEKDYIQVLSIFYPILKSFKLKNISDISYSVFKCKDKKFKKIIVEILSKDLDFFILNLPKLEIANRLIRSKFNPDQVYNAIKLGNNHPIGHLTLTDIKFLGKFLNMKKKKGFLECPRLISMLFNSNLYTIVKDTISLIKSTQSEYSESEISELRLFPRKPKSFYDIHNYIVDRQRELVRFDESKTPLMVREDLLKLDKKPIKVGKKVYRVLVAKDTHDLIRFGMKSTFDNCVGTYGDYKKRGIKGHSAFVGIFSEDNKPLYCIETSKYSFREAKGVSNSSIPAKIKAGLELLLTTTPTIPDDFVKVEKVGFIIGYKYNPESETMFILFNKSLKIYEYENVSNEVYEEFANQSGYSKGAFFREELRDSKKHPYHLIGDL